MKESLIHDKNYCAVIKFEIMFIHSMESKIFDTRKSLDQIIRDRLQRHHSELYEGRGGWSVVRARVKITNFST